MIEDFMKRYREVRQEIIKNQNQIVQLTSQLKELQTQLPKLLAEKERAKRSDPESLDNAIKTEGEVSDAIESIRKAKQHTEQILPHLNDALLAAETELWKQVYDDLKVDIQNTMTEKMFRAYAAKLKTGQFSYPSLVNDIFGQGPSPESVKQYQNELIEKYIENR